jgi:CRP-like cAMP-binding protein
MPSATKQATTAAVARRRAAFGATPEISGDGPLAHRTFVAGQVISGPTDPANRLFRVQSGRVRVVRRLSGKRQVLVALHGAGDVFGDLSGPAEERARESAVADCECEVDCLGGDDVLDFVEGDAPAATALIAAVAAQTFANRKRADDLARADVPTRVAAALQSIGRKHGQPCAHGGALDLPPLTEQDLADLIGSSRGDVHAEITGMKRLGIIGGAGLPLCLRDLDGLQKRAAAKL